MIISDLDYLSLDLDAADGLRGSLAPTAATSAIALTKPGLAYADANAFAAGQSTYTAALANTGAIAKPFITLSYAYAGALAYSQNGGSQPSYLSVSLDASATFSSGPYSATFSLN